MAASNREKASRYHPLRRFGESADYGKPCTDHERYGLAVSVAEDFESKRLAMEGISKRLFVSDADQPQYASAQNWIEACCQQVRLPLNFCGGLLIIRVYRAITPPTEQNFDFMGAVQDAAAAYDFAFLALGHADDEADMTLVRDGEPTRFVTHPHTRAVDGINLALSGLTAMQDALSKWPHRVDSEQEGSAIARHPLTAEIMETFIRALREASFPIILDRADLGHVSTGILTSAGLAPILIDDDSLRRVDLFARHRAHTYFMRATELAVLLAGYNGIDKELAEALDELFCRWGSMGAAVDDLQDIFFDFAAGIHSVCTVMAHLCVAEDKSVRPEFRKAVPEDLIREQRTRLALFFGAADGCFDRAALATLLNELELRRALAERLEEQGALLAAAIYKAAFHFGFDPKLMMELVAVVCCDPEFEVPDIYLSAFQTVTDEMLLQIMSFQIGKFITEYVLERYWPGRVAA